MKISCVAKVKSDCLHNEHYHIDHYQDELIIESQMIILYEEIPQKGNILTWSGSFDKFWMCSFTKLTFVINIAMLVTNQKTEKCVLKYKHICNGRSDTSSLPEYIYNNNFKNTLCQSRYISYVFWNLEYNRVPKGGDRGRESCPPKLKVTTTPLSQGFGGEGVELGVITGGLLKSIETTVNNSTDEIINRTTERNFST